MRYLNTVRVNLEFEFTTDHQLSDLRLQELAQAIVADLSNQGGAADLMLDGLREQVDEDEGPDDWSCLVPHAQPKNTSEAFGPLVKEAE